jgi:hypothetical protein
MKNKELQESIEEFCFTDKITPEVVFKILEQKEHIEQINKRLIKKIKE